MNHLREPGVILLDKDGVLVDFHRTWKPAIRRAAMTVAAGDEALARELLIAVGYVPGRDAFLPGSIWAAGTQEELFDAWAALLPARDRAHIAAMTSAVLRAAKPRPPVPLSALRARLARARRLGWKTAVVTNDLTAASERTLEDFRLGELFDAVVGSDVCARPKPHPDLARAACRETGRAPEAAVVVGDNAHDGEMAARAGCAAFVGVLTGTSGHADLADLADIVVPDVINAIDAICERTPAPAAASEGRE